MTSTSLPPLRKAFETSAWYWGECGDWLVAYTTHRDADTLARSNWICFIKALGGDGSQKGDKGSADVVEGKVRIEEASHWAVGWVQYLVIHPDATDLIGIAERIRAELDDYPVVDEMHWSEMEFAEYERYFQQDAHHAFRRGLKDLLSDRALDLVGGADVWLLMDWFEKQIPSGEYQEDGYPNFSYVFDTRGRELGRDAVADLLKRIRASKVTQ